MTHLIGLDARGIHHQTTHGLVLPKQLAKNKAMTIDPFDPRAIGFLRYSALRLHRLAK
jgi:hypothetical protein